jgi:tetratricopeptide (TPR) repeat protein
MRKLVLSVLVLMLGVVSTPAFARTGSDDAEVTRMAKEHYKLGLEAYQTGNFATAIKELKKAYLLKRLPALLLNIGATYRKMNDNDNAISYYKKYLTEAPDARDRGDVEKIVAELQAGGAHDAAPADEKAADKPADAPPADEPRSERALVWSHTPVDAAPPDTPVDVRVTMPVMKGVKVYLYYRESGAPEFSPVVMKRHGNEKVGRIPAAAMNGKSIQYYIEAKDDKGNVLNKSGTPADPNIVMIDPNARPVMIAAEGEAAPAATDSKSAHADLDDEAAPIMGTVAQNEGRHGRSARGGKRFGGAFYAGVVFMIAGAALVGTGSWALFQAKSYADALTSDSNGSMGMPYKFNDPNAMPYDDRTVEQRGRNYNTMGIAMTAAGGVAAAAGIVMIAVDQTVMAKRRATEKPHRSAWYLAPAAGPSYAGLGGGITF